MWKQISKGQIPENQLHGVVGLIQPYNIKFNSPKEAIEECDMDVYFYCGGKWMSCYNNYVNDKLWTIDWWYEVVFDEQDNTKALQNKEENA